MAVPRKKVSNQKRNQRRSHHALKIVHTNICDNCGASHLPHVVCSTCGFYKGRKYS